jgi:hypothetical protein
VGHETDAELEECELLTNNSGKELLATGRAGTLLEDTRKVVVQLVVSWCRQVLLPFPDDLEAWLQQPTEAQCGCRWQRAPPAVKYSRSRPGCRLATQTDR